jgi:hypothetical protein
MRRVAGALILSLGLLLPMGVITAQDHPKHVWSDSENPAWHQYLRSSTRRTTSGPKQPRESRRPTGSGATSIQTCTSLTWKQQALCERGVPLDSGAFSLAARTPTTASI